MAGSEALVKTITWPNHVKAEDILPEIMLGCQADGPQLPRSLSGNVARR